MLDAPVCWAEGVRAPLWQPGAGKARCGRHFGRQCVCPSNPCVLLLLLLLLLLPLGDRLWKTLLATYRLASPLVSHGHGSGCCFFFFVVVVVVVVVFPATDPFRRDLCPPQPLRRLRLHGLTTSPGQSLNRSGARRDSCSWRPNYTFISASNEIMYQQASINDLRRDVDRL
ncbi:hypothetical protein IWX47DRAFT_855665, partial [Phyllosticta citricarpa]